MTSYFKSVRPDGGSFYNSSFKWNMKPGGVTTHPNSARHGLGAAHYLSVSKVATDCAGSGWPCRLLVVEPSWATFTPDPQWSPNKIAGFEFRTVDELPAWQVFGTNGEAVVAVIERASRLTTGEIRRLDDRYRSVAAASAISAALASTWEPNSAAAWSVARSAASVAVIRSAVGDETWAATRTAIARPAAFAAALAATGELAKDLISQEKYETLMNLWWSVVGKNDFR